MKKKLVTIRELIGRFFEDWKEFSFNVALGRIVRDCPFFEWEFRRNYYEKRIYDYIKTEYKEVVLKCAREYREDQSSVVENPYIWVMWWQGEETMPPIVKTCYSSLKRATENRKKVILITEDNWNQYIELPKVIMKKVASQNISLTHFSDIIRISLLKKWGGQWIDATVYVYEFPKQMETEEFYTLRAPGMFPEFITRGEWGTFLLSLRKKGSLFATCLEEMFFSYWEKHSKVVDYLLFDYFIRLLVNEIPSIEKLISAVDENREFYTLNLNINKEFALEDWNMMIKKSPLHKLTYKKDFYMKTPEGNETYYSFLMRKEQIDYE